VAKRFRDASVILAIAVAALGIAGITALVDGSANFAWVMVVVGSSAALFAIGEALGLENWIRQASPTARRAYLASSLAFFVAAVGAYLIWQTVALWWLAPVASLPLLFLLLWESDSRSGQGSDDFSGPLTPP
jgi:choline-glycine betaine transporter